MGLELGDLVRQRGLGDEDFFGGFGEVQLVCDRQEVLQLAQFDAVRKSYHQIQTFEVMLIIYQVYRRKPFFL
jgi:hypothetical protein